MPGVRRARFCYNRKEAESTYFPLEMLRANSGDDVIIPDGRLDLSGWGIRDADLSVIGKVSQ